MYLKIVGMLLCNLCGGCINLAGSISTYLLSYLYYKDSSFKLSDIVIISFIAITTQALNFFIISKLTSRLRETTIMILGLVFACILIVVSSFVDFPYLFIFFIGISLGLLGSNLIFPSVWICQRKVTEKNKSFVTGFGLAGFALSPYIFSLVFTAIVNPENDKPDVEVENNGVKFKIFNKDISENVQVGLWVFSAVILVLGTIAILCFYEKNSQVNARNVVSTMSFKDLVKKGVFWLILFIDYLKMFSFLFVINIYKAIGVQFVKNSEILLYLSGVGFIIGALSRVFFGKLLDKISWVKLNLMETLLEFILYILYAFSLNYPAFVMTVTILLIGFSNIAHLTIWILTDKLFSEDKWVFSIVSLMNPISLLSVYLVTLFIIPAIGYSYTFLIIAFLNFIAIILIFFTQRYFNATKVSSVTKSELQSFKKNEYIGTENQGS